MDIVHFSQDIWHAIVLFFENVNIAELIKKQGHWFYGITFIWTFLEGETFVIFAGAAAAKGILNIKFLILAAWTGSYCGDQLYFYLGRRFGKAMVKNNPKMQARIDKVGGLIKKYDVAFILSYRFLYGIRNISSLAMGMSGLDWKKFAFWNLWAALIWALVFSLTGYFFGDTVGKSLGSAIDEVMIGLVIVVVGFFIIQYIWKKLRGNKDSH
jgi:membrane protein DedA with SNARE-associated domain